MRVVVSGGTGVLGRAAVRSLREAGHETVVLSRSDANDATIADLDAESVRADLFDTDSLVAAYAGADAAVNLASHVPVGYAAMLPNAWRLHDRLRTEGVANVVTAARRAGVRRIVQDSVSSVYADGGDTWIDENSPIEITHATEPAAVGESHVQDYACDSRAGVVLRFGTIVGDDDLTRFWLRAAAGGRPVGVGRPDQWAHLVHTDDLGSAVVAALHAPSGVYNVGAEPVLRTELVDGYAKAAGVAEGALMGPVLRRFAGSRIEPLGRSLRVSSQRFATQTGWQLKRSTFDPAWFDAATPVAL